MCVSYSGLFNYAQKWGLILMMIDKAFDELTKKNKIVVGFDLENDFSQISYCRLDQSMPETFSQVMGEEEYDIPTVLCRLNDKAAALENADEEKKSCWLIGRDAVKASEEGRGILIEDIVLNARYNTPIEVGDVKYKPDMLLGIYIRKALALLGAYISMDDISCIAFTLKEMKPEMMKMIKDAMDSMYYRKVQICFQSHEDCFYQYIIHQPEEMWIHDVILYDYRKSGVLSYDFQVNRQTNPIACFIDTDSFPQMKMPDTKEMTEESRQALYKRLDAILLDILEKQCYKKNITSIFLLGDFFSKEWCKESLKYMCHGRRVFQGNNLFSKGACYGAREKMLASTLSTSYVYLSDDKLRANIGMKCDRGQEEIYFPILDAGTNWYDANKNFDVMLVKNNVINLVITPVDGGRTRVAQISLEGLKVRGNKTNRVGLKFYMNDSKSINIEIVDKGFGEMFPSTGQVWKERIPIEAIE